MKILIDPIYTGKAHKCSTSYLAWEVIKGLVSWRSDVFFYLMYPKAAESDPDQMAFLQQMPDRVKLYPYPYIQSDRIEEMWKLNDDMFRLLAPGDSPVWDYDVVLSSRIPMLPFMRNASGRENNFPKGTERLFIGLEEMPIFSFRDTVSWASGGNMDLQSLAAYQSAGAIVINNLWTKTEVLKVARSWLGPAQVLDLQKSIHEALPVKLKRLQTKPDEIGDTLNVVFAGRMTGTRNFKEVAELFRKHFSFPLNKGGKKLRFIVSTNSMSTGAAKVGDIGFVEVQHNTREEFFKVLAEEAHLVVNLSTVEDFSLSTYEPLLFGVPVILPKHSWTGFVGPNYPFRANNFVEAYALIKEFALDYTTQMAKFREWEDTDWKSLVEGPRNVCTEVIVKGLIEAHEKMVYARLDDSEAGKLYREIVAEIEDEGLTKVDALFWAHDHEKLKHKKSWRGIPISLRPNTHWLKIFMNRAGWRDTLEPGVVIKA